MSLEDWLRNGWLKAHQTSRQEIQNLFNIIQRDLQDACQEGISEDWRFAIAYNAARQCCTVALYCRGYRVERGGSEHYRIINSLKETLGTEYQAIQDYLDSCRVKRNVSDYDTAGAISGLEVTELIQTSRELYEKVRAWVIANYPDLG